MMGKCVYTDSNKLDANDFFATGRSHFLLEENKLFRNLFSVCKCSNRADKLTIVIRNGHEQFHSLDMVHWNTMV